MSILIIKYRIEHFVLSKNQIERSEQFAQNDNLSVQQSLDVKNLINFANKLRTNRHQILIIKVIFNWDNQ